MSSLVFPLSPQDGHLDVVAAFRDLNKVSWFHNDGASPPTWTEHVLTTDALGAFNVFAADVSGDGSIDIMSASLDDNTIRVFFSDNAENSMLYYGVEGIPYFREHIVTTDADNAQSVYAAYLDGDARMDLLSASKDDDAVRWYESAVAYPTPTPTMPPGGRRRLLNLAYERKIDVSFTFQSSPALNGFTNNNVFFARLIHDLDAAVTLGKKFIKFYFFH